MNTADQDEIGSPPSSGGDDEDAKPRLRRNVAIPLWFLALLAGAHAIYFARTLLVPIVTAVFAYLALRPLVRRSKHWGVPPAVAAAVLLLSLAGIIALGVFFVYEPAQTIIEDVPSYSVVVKERMKFILERLDRLHDATDQLAAAGESEPGEAQDEPIPVQIQQPAWNTNLSIVSGTGNLLSFVTIAAALLYFLLATGDEMLRGVMSALPDFAARRRLFEVIESVQEGLSGYLAQVSVINCGLGVAVGLAMWLLGMPSPTLWGVMAMAFNFIPIVGAIAGAAIIFLVALVNFDQTYYAFVVTGAFLCLTTVEGQFITPTILGRKMNISPILVMLSVVVWGWFWGMMGVFLSVPILIAVRLTCEQYESMAPLSLVLGGHGKPPKPAAEDSGTQGDPSGSPTATTAV